MSNKNVKKDNSVSGVRSKQNLSCNWTGTADFGRLIPIHWEELLPTDHVITCKPRIEVQMLPLASPTFGKIQAYVHYFLVPLRLLQDDFYQFWSQTGVNKNYPMSYVTPKMMTNLYQSQSNAGYKRMLYKHWTSLGLPPFFDQSINNVSDDQTPISLLPFRAYNKIWWDFYRDPEVLRDESQSTYLDTAKIRGKFTDGNIPLPISTWALQYLSPQVRTIKNNWISDLFAQSGDAFRDFPFYGNTLFPFEDTYYNQSGMFGDVPDSPVVLRTDFDEDNEGAYAGPNSSKMLRLVESLNRLAERLSLSGKREIEALYARYGVKPNWAKMNLVRYLGGGKADFAIDDLISTADTMQETGDWGSPLGAKAGTGVCGIDNINIQCTVDEPSILMGIMTIMPHIHYVQGLSKKWQRKELQDFFQDSLQYVGEVGVAKREVGMKYTSRTNYDTTKDGEVFAYSDPYYEYKMGLDILAGDFMKYHNVTLPLDNEEQRKNILYMQSMEQYIDYPVDRLFNAHNLLVSGDQYNKIFYYLGGFVDSDTDDHFHICVDKEVIIDRPMEGFAIPTLETTADPHKVKQPLSSDTML